jgi:predicted nucleic acid-binding protein
MKPVFLDTSYAIALLNRADPHHVRATQLAEALRNPPRPILTTSAVLFEIGDGFATRGRWSLVEPFMNEVMKDPAVQIEYTDAALLERVIAFRNARQDKRWSLTDCLSFVVMTDRSLDEALTADKHFVQAGFRAMLLEVPTGMQP